MKTGLEQIEDELAAQDGRRRGRADDADGAGDADDSDGAGSPGDAPSSACRERPNR